jgi:hypothetical protein
LRTARICASGIVASTLTLISGAPAILLAATPIAIGVSIPIVSALTSRPGSGAPIFAATLRPPSAPRGPTRRNPRRCAPRRAEQKSSNSARSAPTSIAPRIPSIAASALSMLSP